MTTIAPVSQIGDPPWEIAALFPAQGYWSEDDYLELDGNRLVEFCEGRVEVLPMPTNAHQTIVFFLARVLHAFVAASDLGKVLPAPIPVRLKTGKFREPNVAFLKKEHRGRILPQYWDGADLVVEVVTEGHPDRDVNVKRAEYAQAGIAEYWIVDPRDQTITVLTLPEGSDVYEEAGKYGCGQKAESVLLAGFCVDVDEAFSQA